MIYRFLIYDKSSTCIYYDEWSVNNNGANKGVTPAAALDAEEMKRNTFGLVFELKRFLSKLSPSPTAPDYFSYTTNKYKLHVYETATSMRFVLLTDTKTGNMKQQLKKIYSDVYVETVVKSLEPRNPEDPSIQGNKQFTHELNLFLSSIS
eukprot:TRINITY_DN21139_c0_g1_i1.p1 TRINITY_DN21139_c0_g1~~TRINITY_DN21139_c0_g1_i1.p1  ORF type:complete len:162 (+),score=35.23 TRINITY_DN21139_c0_g1_i1:37-486(+)